MENLLKREQELKEQLSYIGGQINRNKDDLGRAYRTLNKWKCRAYTMKCELQSWDIEMLMYDIGLLRSELNELNGKIKWKRESVKDTEQAQRELTYEYKYLNRQLCKIQRRIKKKLNTTNNQ